ncbi:MAG: hypothetical protein HY959_04155 [Ignavibacteriae bacterium]|nr:hypothetical protein [Ignavibacteriota bacterium]
MHKIFLTVLILILFIDLSFAQVEPETNYSVQGDFTSALLINTISGNGDFDILKIKKGVPAYLGLRLGVQRFYVSTISFGGGSGQVNGSPFTDVDLLGKFTISGRVFDLNLCPGITHHSVSNSSRNGDDGIYPKLVADVKLKIFKNTAGLLLKLAYSKESYGGIGLFVGFSTKDK